MSSAVARSLSQMKRTFLHAADLTAPSQSGTCLCYCSVVHDAGYENVDSLLRGQYRKPRKQSEVLNSFWQLPLMYWPDDHKGRLTNRKLHRPVFCPVAATAPILPQQGSSFITWWVLTGTNVSSPLTSIHNLEQRWRRRLSLVDLSLTKSIVELYSQLPLLSPLT